MAAPAHAFAIARAAQIQIPHEDEHLLWDLALEIDPEEGLLWIYATDQQETQPSQVAELRIFGNWSPSIEAATHLRDRECQGLSSTSSAHGRRGARQPYSSARVNPGFRAV
jgi:hypothetical protein